MGLLKGVLLHDTPKRDQYKSNLKRLNPSPGARREPIADCQIGNLSLKPAGPSRVVVSLSANALKGSEIYLIIVSQ